MPMPPDVRAQGQPPADSGNGTPAIMMAQNGMQGSQDPQGDAIANAQKAMDAFEKATGDLYSVMKDLDPQAEAMFPQMIEWGKAMKDRVQQLADRQGQGAATPQPAQPASNPAEAPPGPVAMAA